jgi:hypothetical protein
MAITRSYDIKARAMVLEYSDCNKSGNDKAKLWQQGMMVLE